MKSFQERMSARNKRSIGNSRSRDTMRAVGKVCTSVLALCLVVTTPTQMFADGAAEQAQALMDSLNPVNAALGPLIDRAVAKGDSALQQRLLQLQGIINEALLHLDDIAKHRIAQIDDSTKNRLNQVQQAVNDSATMFDAILRQQIESVNDLAAERIQDMQNASGNLVASLPIPIEPLVNVGKEGFFVAKQVGAVTVLYITGSGLRKNDTAPTAYIVKQESEPLKGGLLIGCSSNKSGERIDTGPASMGLVEFRIQNKFLSDEPRSDYTLVVTVRRGNTWFVLPSYSSPSFPLHVCGSLPPYTGELQLTASGSKWERRTIPFPGSTTVKGVANGFYIDDAGSNNHLDKCARDADGGGWEADEDAGSYQTPGESGTAGYGLSVARWGADRYGRILANSPKKGCVQIYADSREGPANVWIAEVSVHQRKAVSTDQCTEAPIVMSRSLSYGQNNQLQFKPSDAYGPCKEAGLSESPHLRARFALKDKLGKTIEVADLTSGAETRLLDGRVRVLMNQNGLVNVNLGPVCKWKPDVVVSSK